MKSSMRSWGAFKTLWRFQQRSWMHRCLTIWLRDPWWLRWGVPVCLGFLCLGLGRFGLGVGVSWEAEASELQALQRRIATHNAKWGQDEAIRQRTPWVEASFQEWQRSLRWPQVTPWLQWPEQARPMGVTLHRISVEAAQRGLYWVEHEVALEGRGRLSDIDAFWRDLGRQGWWITPKNMRMELSDDGAPQWQARWVVHEALTSVPQPIVGAAQAAPRYTSKEVQRWISEGGPSIADAHARVPVVTPLKVDTNWDLAGLSPQVLRDGVLPTPWPHAPWERMRLVGRWMRGQQVVALVAVDDVVHAVVPGMRLGPQQHEVVRVAMDGVWIKIRDADEQERRVLHWPSTPTGGDS